MTQSLCSFRWHCQPLASLYSLKTLSPRREIKLLRSAKHIMWMCLPVEERKATLLLGWQGWHCSEAAISSNSPVWKPPLIDWYKSDFFFLFLRVIKHRITMHSFACPCAGTNTASWVWVRVCVDFFSPIWPLDDETAAPAFWHDLSLHIRPLWWRLSAWHTRICPWLIHLPYTHVHSCLYLPYTHTLPRPTVNHSSWKSETNISAKSTERDSRCLTPLTPWTDLKLDTHMQAHAHCTSRGSRSGTVNPHISSCISFPSNYMSDQRNVRPCTNITDMPANTFNHTCMGTFLLLLWYMAHLWILPDWSCVCS